MVPGAKRRGESARSQRQYAYRRVSYRGPIRKIPVPPRWGWTIYGLVVAALVLHLVFGSGGIRYGNQLSTDLERVQERNVLLQREHKRLNQQVASWKSDDFGLEKISRERYGMAGADELVFYFDDDNVVPPVPGDGLEEGLEARVP